MRAMILIGLLALCVGPAPGEVGGCNSDTTVADAEDFCRQQSAWICRRQEFRGEIADVQGCVDEIPAACAGSNWPFTCQPFPTNREAQACIDALALESNVETPVEDLSACNLCGGS
ncbi:MAG: hypothetical protein AAGE52_04725 [Myxococcota bacterium]